MQEIENLEIIPNREFLKINYKDDLLTYNWLISTNIIYVNNIPNKRKVIFIYETNEYVVITNDILFPKFDGNNE